MTTSPDPLSMTFHPYLSLASLTLDIRLPKSSLTTSCPLTLTAAWKSYGVRLTSDSSSPVIRLIVRSDERRVVEREETWAL